MGEVERIGSAQQHLDDGDPLGALDVLRSLGDDLHGHATALQVMGRAYYRCAQLDKAQVALERAVALDPDDVQARFALGRTLERRSRPREALRHLRIAAALSGREDYQERVDAVVSALHSAA